MNIAQNFIFVLSYYTFNKFLPIQVLASLTIYIFITTSQKNELGLFAWKSCLGFSKQTLKFILKLAIFDTVFEMSAEAYHD